MQCIQQPDVEDFKVSKGEKYQVKKNLDIKFRYFEKVTKFEKNSHLVLKLLGNVKTSWEIFVAFLEYLNFKKAVVCITFCMYIDSRHLYVLAFLNRQSKERKE